MTKPDQPLHKQLVLFTGRLASAKRQQAQLWVEEAGGHCAKNLSKKTTLVVVGMLGWAVLPNGAISKSLEKAELYQQQGQPLDIISEAVFLERIGRNPAKELQSGSMELESAARLINVDVSDLHRWEQFGLVRFDNNRLSFQDLVSLRNITQLLQKGLSIDVIAKTLHTMQRLLPELERPLAQARLLQSQDQSVLVELQGTKMNTSGQLLLDFETADNSTQQVPEILPRKTPDSGIDSNLILAADNKRQLNEHSEAVDLYRRVLQQHHDNPLGWYNLAYCLDELGELHQAIDALGEAIKLDDDFADAVFNLARCHERMHQHHEAVPYWTRYLQLDPHSEWSKIARRFLHYG